MKELAISGKRVLAALAVLFICTPFVSAMDSHSDEKTIKRFTPGPVHMSERESNQHQDLNVYSFGRGEGVHDNLVLWNHNDRADTEGYRLREELVHYSPLSDNRYGTPLVMKHTDFERSGRKTFFLSNAPHTLGSIATVGAAFLTNMMVHEFGHKAVADYAGAAGSKLNFFAQQDGQFFLGMSNVDTIEDESVLPYTMGGEVAADLTFEHALSSYRKKPTIYNSSLLLFSGIDFLFYTFYAYYLTEGHPGYDPTTIAEETGMSKDLIFTVALAKTALNAYRIYSGYDSVVPYFTVNKTTAMLNFSFPFEINTCAFGNCKALDLEDEGSGS